MGMDIKDFLTGGAASGIVAGLLKTVLPEKIDWVAEVVETVWDLVGDLMDKDTDDSGPVKMQKIIDAVSAALDKGTDDIPGWDKLGEVGRDQLISGIAEVAVFANKAAKRKALPNADACEAFAVALGDLARGIFAIVRLTADVPDMPKKRRAPSLRNVRIAAPRTVVKRPPTISI